MYNFTETVEMIKESIAAMGSDYVYQRPKDSITCLYAHITETEDGETKIEPGCIVGDILIRQHILTLDELAEIQEEYPDGRGDAYDMTNNLRDMNGTEFTDKARDLLKQVQGAQDIGTTWGQALENGLYVAGGQRYEFETERRLMFNGYDWT